MLLQAKEEKLFQLYPTAGKKALAYLSYCDGDLIPAAASCKVSLVGILRF